MCNQRRWSTIPQTILELASKAKDVDNFLGSLPEYNSYKREVVALENVPKGQGPNLAYPMLGKSYYRHHP